MIVHVIAMDEMEPPIMDVIHVIAMLDSGVFLAIMPVHVIIGRDHVCEFLGDRIGRGNLKRVFVVMPTMRRVKMTVMQVIDMAGMFERHMAAILAMRMIIMARMKDLVRIGTRSERGGSNGEKREGSFHRSVSFVFRSRGGPSPLIRPCHLKKNDTLIRYIKPPMSPAHSCA